MKRVGLGVLIVLGLGALALFAFQKPIGNALFERAVAQAVGVDRLGDFGDGLHLGLCGTGSPMPNLERAGPCNIVIAGDQVFAVDIGEGGNEVINTMGISSGDLDGLFLTHFHSDHIDGLGPLMLFHWTRGTATAPLPVYGPTGVEAIVEGFNAAYATDDTYRIAHHGEGVVPASGGGGEAQPFTFEGASATVFEKDGLSVTAFAVDHDPVRPAVGYRFDYKGRSLCISGDAARSANLEAACKDVDILVHDALQPAMVEEMRAAMEARGQTNAAKIFHDIQDYHASPEEAAESASAAEARMLVLSHLVPPLPMRYLYPAFLGDAESRYNGPIVVGEDGMVFTLPPGGTAIERSRMM
ncbi:MBL fold metallo-hydrolase [Qipengyuania flava]|uniref:MBL fold metallo-hydrolase n=1 Tax=Qipengyuania flava TaxID=192812 RepID=UPI001C63A5A2|nr:MBL fold metallo-hydrolase [Qipengyuania flava]QYJ07796.1 MBL fold metallo-hydrolase [Qipengyuania flava]